MALDLAGFTSLTDRMSAVGTRGTEALSRILGAYFASVTDLVAEAGGDPLAFGGDSLSIVFDGPPRSTVEEALGAAAKIQQLTAETAGTPTPAGPLPIQVRVGIARGTVATAVARSRRRLLPVHVGPGLDLAHAAQETARTGAVAVHDLATLRERAARSVEPASGSLAVDGLATVVDVGQLLSEVLLDRLRHGRAMVETHRVVTVAFVRFPAVEPGALRPFLDRVTCLMDLVDASGGEVVQVSGGDKGVLGMVVFGAPTVHADDPVRTVHGMLDLLRREPDVAVGIATGPVFAAVLGSRSRMFPMHSGLAVNVAARLSQLADTGGILVDDETWEGASRYLRPAGRSKLSAVKGCANPVRVHRVAGWRRSPPRLTRSALPLMVGRGGELDRIERLLDGMEKGQGGVLAIEGEPGIGKTRLVQVALERAGTRGYSLSSTDLADYPRGHPVGAWREVVGGLLGLHRNAPRRTWLAALARALPDVPGPAAILGPLLDLGDAAPARPGATDTGSLAHELAAATLGRLLDAASRRGPVLLVVENVDRLDEVSLDVLRGVATATAAGAAGLLMTLGQDESALTTFLTQVPMLNLATLDPDDTGLLAEEAWRQAGGGTPPTWLAGAVVSRAGGNPLFARVVARALLSSWTPGDPPPAADLVSGSVNRLLLSQVDRLPPAARELLTVLAVVQRPCTPQLLTQVIPPAHDGPTVREVAARLVSERLVRQGHDGTAETYGLTHDLLRDVVYGAASHAERERLHRRLVDSLGGAGADPVEVAEHVHPLGDDQLARRWFPPAARTARDSWNLAEALRWLQRLEPLVDGSARDLVEVELLEVLLVAGRAKEILDRVDGDVRWSELASGGSPDSSQQHVTTRRLHVLAEATYSCGQLERTEVLASRVMRLTDGVDEPRYQRAAELLTLSRCHHGDVDGAVSAGRLLVDRATRTTDSAARANALAALAVALVLSGQPEAAEERYRDALVAAHEAGDVVREVHVLSDLAGCAHLTGRYAVCVELMAQARDRADAIGYRRHLALNLSNEAQLRATLGDAYATSCAAVAVGRSLELGDLPAAADALHTWLTARPAFAADPSLWRRLVDLDLHLDRSLESAAEWAELALALARMGRGDEARAAALRAERSARDSPGPRSRAAFARLVAEAHDPAGLAPHVRSRVLAGLSRLAGDADLDEREMAEVAVESWRLSRSGADRTAALLLARKAFGVEPSEGVRTMFRMLREPVPAALDPLPPPVGITRTRTTRRDLEEALAGVEEAVRASRR